MGSNMFQGGSNSLFPIETHITCDFPGGSGPPIPPSGSALVNDINQNCQTTCLNWTMYTLKCALMQDNLPSRFWNNKGADQPAHLRSLISAFVIPLLECIISKLATCKLTIIACLKGGCRGSSESTYVIMAHCWKSHVTAHIFFFKF